MARPSFPHTLFRLGDECNCGDEIAVQAPRPPRRLVYLLSGLRCAASHSGGLALLATPLDCRDLLLGPESAATVGALDLHADLIGELVKPRHREGQPARDSPRLVEPWCHRRDHCLPPPFAPPRASDPGGYC